MSRVEKKTNKSSELNIKRLLLIRSVTFLVLAGLIIRLFYIQVIRHDFYNAEVMKQRQLSIPVDSGRGLILDRNFIPLTDRVEQNIAVVFPQHFILNENNILLLQDITGQEQEELLRRIKNSKYTLEFPVEKDLNRDDKNLVE